MTHEKSANANDPRTGAEAQPDYKAIPFGSNAVRLSASQWVIVASIVLLVIIATPVIWNRIEPFDASADFRVPYDLSNDYRTYQRFVESAVGHDRILVIGDSVVWGEYVDPQHTLSHYLNLTGGQTRFANGGLNGTHPLALEGLVESYAADVSDTQVILHCNLLWMSSKERDLQTEKELTFNHPQLVPQFVPSIPCYKAPVDERMGIAIDRHIAYRRWVNHLRVAYFDSQDIASWTLEHPYKNPISQMRLESLQPKSKPHSQPISWLERGIQTQDIPWIGLDTSLQWQAFRATVELLRQRGNNVFVIVGPFNEHMLTGASRNRYRTMVEHVESWLGEHAVPFYAAPQLPSHEYADASHPLSAGYARLAEEVYESAGFQRWLSDQSNESK
jgi:lysophospholipase L1-like esterase